MNKGHSGIAMITLVITIIVMTILAGTAIVLSFNSNGVIEKAEDARNQTNIEQEQSILKEAVAIALAKSTGTKVDKSYLNKELERYPEIESTENTDEGVIAVFQSGRAYIIDAVGEVTQTTVMATLTTPPTTAVNENTRYRDTNDDIAVIPAGFRVSDDPDEQTIDTGLVVKDSNNNEWVWIPVSNANEMFTTEGGPFTLSESVGVTTNIRTKAEILSGRTYYNPGTSGRSEPDILHYKYPNTIEEDYSKLGYTSLYEMALDLVNDYQEMANSIRKYNGFYIGRYELTGTIDNPTQVSGVPIVNKDWYDLYNACKKFSINGVMESRMIWGCQWDAIMAWMLNSDNEEVRLFVTDSRNLGYYSRGGTINTGSNDNYKVNNIYDLAGNCGEWTQEKTSTAYRTTRGGMSSNRNGDQYPASSSQCTNIYSKATSSEISSRPVFYIKIK